MAFTTIDVDRKVWDLGANSSGFKTSRIQRALGASSRSEKMRVNNRIFRLFRNGFLEEKGRSKRARIYALANGTKRQEFEHLLQQGASRQGGKTSTSGAEGSATDIGQKLRRVVDAGSRVATTQAHLDDIDLRVAELERKLHVIYEALGAVR